MTLASDIITRAFRETNLLPLTGTVTSAQQTEALPLLNGQLLQAVGFEAGEDLADLNIGGQYDQSAYCSTWIPANVRLILNLGGAATYKLHPLPYEGQRLAIADAAGNLGTYNLTLTGNGRKIEGAASLVLSTNGDARQWLYRADTANWVKITELVAGDTMPFPVEFDSFFVTRLALRLNPRYYQSLTKETAAELERIERKLRARYRKPRPVQDMPLGLLGERGGYGTIADFNAGNSWR